MGVFINYIERLKKIADDLDCRKLADEVLDNPHFAVWSGSSKATAHHYGFGRLVEHTCEVVELSLNVNSYYKGIGKGVNDKSLFLAALFHDVGKIWDYKTVGLDEWTTTDHKYLIHHITRSVLVWNEKAKAAGWKPKDIDEVTHCILSHHGFREWGSPVEPQTKMAWILHLCDGMSARLDDCSKV